MRRNSNGELPILLAESSAYYVGLIRDWLSELDVSDIYHCTTVRGAEALTTDMRFGVLVIDARLEDGSGLHLARRIRHDPHGPNRMAPMVILDSRSTRRRVLAARDGGASEYVCKPMSRRSFTEHFMFAAADQRNFIKARGYFGPDRRRLRDYDWRGPERRLKIPRKVQVDDVFVEA